ncbi:MAG TPA: hypothetical protein VEW28_07865 [Candidatus Kapabacteria bacterium]|nr:hypothetical protein [Candidatus Kapabacteria bacterium]
MKQDESYNENELKRMEDELRSFGVPYSSNEPDDRYWANFRVRLNEKIDAKKAAASRSIVSTVIEWFSASAFRMIAVGTAAVVMAVASVMIFRSNESNNPTPVVAMNVPAPANTTAPQVSVPSAPATGPAAVATTPHISTAKQSPKFAKVELSHPSGTKQTSSEENIADAASDLSNYDITLSPGKPDEPVDYSTLSEAELKSVLADVSTMSN